MPVANKKKLKTAKKSARKKTGKTPAALAIQEFEPLRKRLYNIHDIGRPLKYKTPRDMALAIEQYFEWIKGEFEDKTHTYKDKRGNKKKYIEKVCIREPEPATITGLILYLGFSGRDALKYYEEKHHDYSDIIKAARSAVEYSYEKRLYSAACTGAIFALKQFGWKDINFAVPDDGQTPTGFNYITPKEPKEISK